jgi:filamin
MRVGTGGRGRSGKTRSSPSHESCNKTRILTLNLLLFQTFLLFNIIAKHRSESPSILYNQSSSKLNTDNYLSRKEVYSPQQTQKSSSYSPQLSPKHETDFYKSTSSRENYVSRFSTTPKREVYSPKYDTDLYSTSYKSEVKKMPNNSPSPINDSYHRDSANSSYKIYSENYSSRQRHDSNSPITHVRDTRSSPITLTTTSHYETSRNMTSSPRNFAPSASPRNVSSPINYSTTTIHRISSPVNASKPNSDSYKMIKETTTFRSPIVQNQRFSSPSMDGVDYTSNVKVTAQASSTTPSRRDSRDVINKTKHLLSHVSLESLANMTETQLNTDLSYTRSKEMDTETVRNTNYNKYNSLVSEPRIARNSVDNEIKSYKYFTDTKTTSNTMTTSKEKNQKYASKHSDGSYIYGTSSNFRTIDENAVGSQAIRVQDIPDGVIGRSVQFESKCCK